MYVIVDIIVIHRKELVLRRNKNKILFSFHSKMEAYAILTVFAIALVIILTYLLVDVWNNPKRKVQDVTHITNLFDTSLANFGVLNLQYKTDSLQTVAVTNGATINVPSNATNLTLQFDIESTQLQQIQVYGVYNQVVDIYNGTVSPLLYANLGQMPTSNVSYTLGMRIYLPGIIGHNIETVIFNINPV